MDREPDTMADLIVGRSFRILSASVYQLGDFRREDLEGSSELKGRQILSLIDKEWRLIPISARDERK